MFGEKMMGFFAREPKHTSGRKKEDGGGSGTKEVDDKEDDVAHFAMTVDTKNPYPMKWDSELIQDSQKLIQQIGWETVQFGPPEHIAEVITEYFEKHPTDSSAELSGLSDAERIALMEDSARRTILSIHRAVISLKWGKNPATGDTPSAIIPILKYVAEHLKQEKK